MRRRVLAFILSICMVVTMITALPSDAEAAAQSSIVRVKLSIGSVTSFSFHVDGNYTVGDTVLEHQTYTVKVAGSNVSLYWGSTLVASGSSITLVEHTASSGRENTLYLNNSLYGYQHYLGGITFSISSGNLVAVNNIDLEDYLYGVVPYEMSDSWYLEALKSQAVAARNYAVKRMGGSGAYDLTDTSSNDQVYKGYDSSATNAIAAVNATAGQVLMSGSTIIDCYYSASNGGWTELPYHRWGPTSKDWTYYRIDYDPYDIANPSSRYETITLPVAIDADHPVTSSTNVSGTIDTDKALAVMRQAIYASGQLSAYGVTSANDFTITGVTDLSTNTYDTSSGQDHSLMPWNGVNECVDKIMATGDYTVSVGGTPAAVTDVTFDMRNLCSSEGGTAFFSASLGIYVVEPVYGVGDVVVAFNLSMRRFGHGLGLSQRGAQQRAKPVSEGGGGQTYGTILGFYYPNTVLTTMSFTKPTLTDVAWYDYSNATVVTDTPLNVRASANTSSTILGVLPDGARVEVTDDFYTSSWHQISYLGGVAYVYASYITLDSPMVQKHVTGVSLDMTAPTLTPGGTLTLTPAVAPSTAVNRAVSWASDNTAVATVNNGVVTGQAEGTANITVTTAEGGYTATCAVTVKSNGITSTKYTITTTYIKGVSENTTVAQLLANLSNDAANLRVYKADGTPVTEGIVATGMYVVLLTDSVETDRLTLVVKGDVNGDGVIAITDYTRLRYGLLNLQPLEGAYLLAGDVNGDGSTAITDYTQMRYHILGLQHIS